MSLKERRFWFVRNKTWAKDVRHTNCLSQHKNHCASPGALNTMWERLSNLQLYRQTTPTERETRYRTNRCQPKLATPVVDYAFSVNYLQWYESDSSNRCFLSGQMGACYGLREATLLWCMNHDLKKPQKHRKPYSTIWMWALEGNSLLQLVILLFLTYFFLFWFCCCCENENLLSAIWLARTYVALVLVVNSFGGSNLELNDIYITYT